MANIKSAKKRIKVIDRQRGENRYVKTTISTYIKNYRNLLEQGKLDEAEIKLRETISLIDSAESKGILHKNTASRKVARLSYALEKARNGSKPASVNVAKQSVVKPSVEEPKKAKTTTKATATKTATKAVKETTTKKAEEKKPATKAETKTTAKKATAKTETKKAESKAEVKKETKTAKADTAKKATTEEKPAKKTATKKTSK